MTGARLVASVCTAQILVQLGAFFWPALLPSLVPVWQLTNGEAGWITAAFYGAYMLAVPILVTLTDRVDAKQIYLLGVACTIAAHVLFGLVADGFWSALSLRALAGIGWAGTYMTGVKLLADKVDAKLMSRAVTGHAASIGVAGAISFTSADLLARSFGWRYAFVTAAATALLAWLIIAISVPRQVRGSTSAGGGAVFDFRPVFRNRSAMAYAQAYCVHTLEMNALRGWGVAFLGSVATIAGTGGWQVSPAYVLTALGLIGTAASVLGNEVAIRRGRRRLITLALSGSILVSASLGYIGTLSYPIAVALLLVYGFVVWLDSSSLTAGAAGTAEPSRRGATLAVHSSLGYAGGFVGPLIIGYVLDAFGGMSRIAWSTAFGSLAALSVLALVVFHVLRPREVAGDKGHR